MSNKKDDLILQLSNSEKSYADGELSQRELVMMRADIGVLKSEFYIMLEEWFTNRADGFYYINRCQALREKIEFDIDHTNRVNKKIREKLILRMGQNEYQDFLKECKSEI